MPLVELEGYWRLFARTTERWNGLTWLQNPALPCIECNASYVYTASKLEHALVLAKQLGQDPLVLSQSGLVVSQSGLVVQPLVWQRLETPPSHSEAGIWVEQVGWNSSRALATAWCRANAASGWELAVAGELAHAIQRQRLLAYLALSDEPGGTPVAMAVLARQQPHQQQQQPQHYHAHLWAAQDEQAAAALYQRIIGDVGPVVVCQAEVVNWASSSVELWLHYAPNSALD
jgi:hypothetical protein